jgi:two-component system, LytTR family, sensor kinase
MRLARERVEARVRENEIMQLATEAELRALRAQLNPHFLFNALTTIGYLMRAAPERALHTLYRLTDLLRAVLRRSDGAFVTLAQEMEIVDAYLSIERSRFEDRLRVTVDIPEDLAQLPVPPLILQPLVENAVKHGIAPRADGGSIVVSARRVITDGGATSLLLSVVDTGVGATPAVFARRRSAGIGLSSVEHRLERLFGAAATIEVRTAPDVGTSVELCFPIGRQRMHQSLEAAS